MKCWVCGKTIPQDVSYCAYCGAAIPQLEVVVRNVPRELYAELVRNLTPCAVLVGGGNADESGNVREVRITPRVNHLPTDVVDDPRFSIEYIGGFVFRLVQAWCPR